MKTAGILVFCLLVFAKDDVFRDEFFSKQRFGKASNGFFVLFSFTSRNRRTGSDATKGVFPSSSAQPLFKPTHQHAHLHPSSSAILVCFIKNNKSPVFTSSTIK